MSVNIKLIGCADWGARQPKHPIEVIGKSQRIIFHHTAGHHPEIEDPTTQSRAESVRYAQDIQAFHMGPERGWNDSGHNFLVCRNGLILQGRWLTISAIRAGLMVTSAHCPTQNDQIGIEHEHKGSESMTDRQREASARLQAWIADQYGRKTVLPVDPHSKWFATSCPTNIAGDITKIRARALDILEAEGDRFQV